MTSVIVQEARQDFRNKMAGKQDAIVTFAALMGRGDGTNPAVMGREGYVWVRVGHAQALQMAYNTRVMPRDDLAIYVGYQPEQPNLLQVISVRQESYVNTGQGVIPVVQDHHLTHEWGGGDDTWIAYRRIVDLHLGQPTGFVVTLNAGLVYRAGAYMWIPVQTLNLAGDQPHVGAQARYDLVYLNAAGVLSARPGNLRPNPTSLLVSDIPIPLAGEIAIAAVRLYASQTAIGDTPTDRDILELRDLQPYSSAGTHNVLSATHADSTAAACVLGDIITGQAGPLWKRLAISVPGVNVRNVLGVDNAETGPTWKTALDAVNPTTIAPSDAAAPGTSLIFSHRDHQHASPATWPATAHALLSATHNDTVASAVARGDLVVGVAGPSWDNLALGGAAGSLLTRDADDVAWSAYYMTGFAGHTYAWPDYSMSFPGADAHGYLHSDGAGTLTWDAGGGGGAHDLLSATHTDTAASAASQGSLIVGNATPAWAELVVGTANSILTNDGTDVAWSTYLITGTAGGTTNLAVTNTKTLTLTATGDFNLTIPATGTAVLGTGANTRIAYWSGTNAVGSDANLTWDATRLTAQIADAATNTVVYPFRVSHITSDTAAATFGVGIEFQNEDAAGTATITGIIASAWIDPLALSQESRFEFRGSLKNVGTENPLIGVICSPTHAHGAGMSDGNARGYGAVDFQTFRNAATQVASGNYAAMLGGSINTASGSASTILGGSQNISSGAHSVIVGGQVNVNAATDSVIIGGQSNDIGAAGDYGVALGYRAHIAHAGVFMFSDSTAADFNSVAAKEFAIRARGGFRHAYNDAYYWTAQITSAGLVTFDITHAAGTPTFTFGHDVAISTLTPSTVIYSDANRVITSLANGAGVLTNDGVGGLSWGGAVAHSLLSATHSDTAVNAANRGSLIYGNSTPVWDELVIGGAAGSFLTRNADDVLWSGFYLAGTAAQTYTFPAAGGTVAMLNAANTFTLGNTMSAILTVNANIQFPAVQVPNAGANVLDDYEELTWTPELKFGGANVNMTYGTQTGYYTKIGRLVFVLVSITLTAKGVSVGAATITGLPFAIGGANSSCAVYCAGVANLTSTVIGRLNVSSILLYDTGATGNTALDDTNFGNTSVLNIGATYSV